MERTIKEIWNGLEERGVGSGEWKGEWVKKISNLAGFSAARGERLATRENRGRRGAGAGAGLENRMAIWERLGRD